MFSVLLYGHANEQGRQKRENIGLQKRDEQFEHAQSGGP